MTFRLFCHENHKRIKKDVAICLLCVVTAMSPVMSGCSVQKTADTTAVSSAAEEPSEQDTSTYYGSGVNALENGDYESAYSYFASSVEKEGREAESRRGQGIAALYLGNYSEAVQLFDEACDAVEYPDQNEDFITDCRFYEIRACLAGELYDKALTLCDSLIRGDHAGEAFLMRGTVYLKTEKYGQAAADFQHAIEADPSYDIYLKIYEAYVDSNREADGAVFLKDALSIEPETADDYYELGRICYELGDYTSAETYLTTAKDDGIADAVALLGRTYLDNNDIDGARSMYQDCVDSGSYIAAGYNGLAICDMEEGDYDAALADITNGLTSSDTSMQEELLYNEIIVYEKKGDFETAASKIRDFLEAYPDNETAVEESRFILSRVEQTSSTPSKVFDYSSDETTEDTTTYDSGTTDTTADTTGDTGTTDTTADTTGDTGTTDDTAGTDGTGE